MRQTTKYISTLMLLLLLMVIGGRFTFAMSAWGCAMECMDAQHHECCSCDCEEERCEEDMACDYHDISIKGQCVAHNLDFEQAATISAESKSHSLKRYITLSFLISPTLTLESLYCGDAAPLKWDSVVAREVEWICRVGLLRAPPRC